MQNIDFTFHNSWSEMNHVILNSFRENERQKFINNYFSKILYKFISKNNNTIFFKKNLKFYEQLLFLNWNSQSKDNY